MIKKGIMKMLQTIAFMVLILLPCHAFGSSWERLPGAAKDIGIGADNSVWVIGTNSVHGGYGIYRWEGKNWRRIDGGAVQISVDKHGVPWVVNADNYIYRKKRSFTDPWFK